jgi:hypothetical protein
MWQREEGRGWCRLTRLNDSRQGWQARLVFGLRALISKRQWTQCVCLCNRPSTCLPRQQLNLTQKVHFSISSHYFVFRFSSRSRFSKSEYHIAARRVLEAMLSRRFLVFGRSFLNEMICLGRHLVCPSVCVSVCSNRELWPDRSTYEHPVWSKICSIHPDTMRENCIRKFNYLPSIFGVKWGESMKKCEKG